MSLLMDAAKGGAETVRKGLGPEDDWATVALVLTRDGQIVPTLLQLPDDDEEREAFWNSVPAALAGLDAAEVALVMSMWMTKRSNLDSFPEDRPSTAPDRIDALVFCRVSADEEEYEMAEVTRHPDGPPTLEWLDVPEGFSLQGRVVDALREGLTKEGA